MPIELWLTFVAASAVIPMNPGLTFLPVNNCSTTYGRRSAARTVSAVALGAASGMVASVRGFGAFVAKWPL